MKRPVALRSLSNSELPRALPNTAELIVELGASIGLADLYRRSEQSESQRATVVTIESPQKLPDRWCGYEGVDLLVIVGAPAVEKLLLDAAVDRSAEAVGSPRRHAAARVRRKCRKSRRAARAAGGIRPRRVRGNDRSPALRRDRKLLGGGTADRRRRRGPPHDPGAAMEKCARPRRTFRAIENYRSAAGRPLAAGVRPGHLRRLRSRSASVEQLAGRGKFLDKLLRLRSASGKPSGATAAVALARHLGYIDLSGQIRSALDQFEGVRLIPFWTVTLLTLAYIVILFPLNYFVATRWLKRQQLAWVIFPVVAIGFCAAAYAMAHQAKGNRLRVNQIDLVDIDAENGWARGSTWFNLFSPANAAYDLSVKPISLGATDQPAPDAEGLLSWFGLAGSGLGAMNSAAASLPLVDQPYTDRFQRRRHRRRPPRQMVQQKFCGPLDVQWAAASTAISPRRSIAG